MHFDSDNETLTLECTYLPRDRSNRPISSFIHNIFKARYSELYREIKIVELPILYRLPALFLAGLAVMGCNSNNHLPLLI
jgi:hypothetical protein